MKNIAASIGRFALTAVMVGLAVLVSWRLWDYYMLQPWTRDGRVRADVVAVAPDVSGLVTDVLVHDNQLVHRGEVLFRIDPARFQLALREAQAAADARRASLSEAMREQQRFQALTSLSVSRERQEQTETAFELAQAQYQQSLADLDTAKLNLQRTQVTASVDGTITNFDLRPGNYVTAGHAVTALVDSDSIRVEGYFEETKLAGIHVGDRVSVRLLGDKTPLHGHVESVSGGIEDRERTNGLLANINPTFSWVRLAQRIPVRIHLDDVPAGVRLLPGRTATVRIETGVRVAGGG